MAFLSILRVLLLSFKNNRKGSRGAAVLRFRACKQLFIRGFGQQKRPFPEERAFGGFAGVWLCLHSVRLTLACATTHHVALHRRHHVGGSNNHRKGKQVGARNQIATFCPQGAKGGSRLVQGLQTVHAEAK